MVIWEVLAKNIFIPPEPFAKGSNNDYYFNSDWPSITRFTSLVDLAKMEHYKEGLDSYYKDEEEQIFELAKYLLETYADREVTFVFQNWEGYWLLRANSANTQWERNPDSFVPDDVDDRIADRIRWFNARQDGVNRARREIQDTKATVAHAIEVNKVWWPERRGFKGNYAPILVTHVLPYVLHWILYCNEVMDDQGNRVQNPDF